MGIVCYPPPPSLSHTHTHTTHTHTVEPNKEVCAALVQMFLSFVDDQTLNQFIQLFLLQSNSSSLRWQAHKLLHMLYQYSQSAEQVQLIDQLWKLWPSVPTYGQKATQFVDLLGFTTISTPEVLEKVCRVQNVQVCGCGWGWGGGGGGGRENF